MALFATIGVYWYWNSDGPSVGGHERPYHAMPVVRAQDDAPYIQDCMNKSVDGKPCLLGSLSAQPKFHCGPGSTLSTDHGLKTSPGDEEVYRPWCFDKDGNGTAPLAK